MSIIITGKYKIGFVHIPKTSGTSIRIWLRQHAETRNDASVLEIGYHSTLPEMQLPAGYTSVAVVRNPWDRMVSFYEFSKFCKEQNFEQGGGAILQGVPHEDMEFNEWMKYVHQYYYTTPRHAEFLKYKIERQPFWFTPLTPQTVWLPQDPTITIRFESLGVGYQKLHEIMKTSVKIPWIYKTIRKPYQEYYNDNSKKIVEKYFALDIERWNYSF